MSDDIDFSDYPPALAADIPIVRDGGLPTDVAVDRALAETAWYQKNLVDLSTRVNTVEDQTGDNTASITTETIARTSADEALADEITTLTATVGSNTANISDEAIARADADSAIAATVSDLTTTVGANTASISTLSASVSGVLVQYSVTGTINTTTGGFELTGVQAIDGSISFGLEFTLNSFRLTDPNLPGGSGNIFSYSGGVFRFNVPVKVGTSDLLQQSVNTFIKAVMPSNGTFASDNAWHDVLTVSVPGEPGAYSFVGVTFFSSSTGSGLATAYIRVVSDASGEILPAQSVGAATTLGVSAFCWDQSCSAPTTYRLQVMYFQNSAPGRILTVSPPTRIEMELRRR